MRGRPSCTESDSFRHAIKRMNRMNRLCADFDAWLERNAWLAGGTDSLADIAFVPYLIRLELLEVDGLWVDRPHVADWYARLNARASAATVWDWYIMPTASGHCEREVRRTATRPPK